QPRKPLRSVSFECESMGIAAASVTGRAASRLPTLFFQGRTMKHLSRRSVLIEGGALIGLLAAGSGLAVADVLDDISKAGVIKIGIFEDFPPFASLGSDMQIQGYDVDMANLIGKALGVKPELVGINGQNRIPYLTEGKVDMLLSIGFSDERAQVVDFTAPYAPYYIVVMGPRDVEVKGPADLKGKTIAVNKGT